MKKGQKGKHVAGGNSGVNGANGANGLNTDKYSLKEQAVESALAPLVAALGRNAYDRIEQDDEAFVESFSGDGHGGDNSRRIDLINAELARQLVTLPEVLRSAPASGIRVMSEDNSAGFHAKALGYPWIIQLDEFDGTTIAKYFGTNWAVAGMIFIWSDRHQKYVLAGEAVACGEGHLIFAVDETLHQKDGRATGQIRQRVQLTKYDTFSERELDSLQLVGVAPGRWIDEMPSNDDDETVAVAVNAAVHGRLADIEAEYPRLLKEADVRTLCAGTPIAYAAIRGSLDLIVDPHPATLHDAVQLLALNAIGWTTVDLDTRQPVPLVDLAEQYAERRPRLTPIPRCATFRNEEALELLGW